MDNDECLRSLVDIICSKDLGSQEICKRHSTLTLSLGKNFSGIFKYVMQMKKLVVTQRWNSFIDTCYRKMFDSHEMYLTFIMFACISEHKCHRNTFESFISVCVVVNHLINQTYKMISVKFSGLAPDIIMAFYQTKMKTTFCKHGGFSRLLDHIYDHPFAKGNSNKADTPAAAFTNKKFQEELSWKITTNPDEVKTDETSINLARNVLSTTKVKLPPLPSLTDLIQSLLAYKRQQTFVKAEVARGILDSRTVNLTPLPKPTLIPISNPKPNHDEEKKDNIENYEKIIQAVIRHNHSKASSEKKASNPKQEEADGVLNNLKGTIESLIKVLDKYDKE